MNVSMVFYLLGWISVCEGALLLPSILTGFLYREDAVWALVITMGICLVLGGLLLIKKPKNRVFYLREGFLITALSWILISILGALPFLLDGAIPNVIDALFETVSGFTTTGASILTNVEALPKCLLFWRSFTHWIGGMGVLVFLLTLLPLASGTGGSYVNLMKAESPGPQVEKLVPKVRYTAMILYGIYLGMTILEIVILLIGKMPVFDALTITFGSAGTGGFGVRNDSAASYTVFQQVVITVFMILFGVNFNFYFFLLLRKFRRAFAMEEVRTYFLIILASILLIAFDILHYFPSFARALQQSAFQVGSIITTTGYSSTDFNDWPTFSRTILVFLMFIGACAGSTGGGIKVSRILVMFKSVSLELHRILHPKSVRFLTLDKKEISQDVRRSTFAFLAAYLVIFASSILVVSVDGLDLVSNFTAVAATLNNIGPGLELVGPTGSFAVYSGLAKVVMIFDMLAGRLELFPLLLLFRKETWTRF